MHDAKPLSIYGPPTWTAQTLSHAEDTHAYTAGTFESNTN